MITTEPLIDIHQLSKEIGITKFAIYSKRRNKKFPEGLILNGRRVFRITEIEEYFKSMNIKTTISI